MYQTVDGQGNITNHVVGSAPVDQEAAQNAATGALGSSASHPASDFVTVTTTVAGHALSSNVSLVKGDVGLGNVDNTADSAKPVSAAQQTALDAKATTASLTSHTSSTSNPHSVTKTQVGLGSVDNTSDVNKPVSTAQATADSAVQSAAATDATTKAAAAQAAAIAAAATDATTKANTAQANAIAASLAAPIVTNSSPTTGQTVSASTDKVDETLYMTPAGTLLALTVALPTAANSRVGQIVRGFISQIITGLTMSVAGTGTLIGSVPITSAVNSSFAYQCVSTSGNGTWIRLY